MLGFFTGTVRFKSILIALYLNYLNKVMKVESNVVSRYNFQSSDYL